MALLRLAVFAAVLAAGMHLGLRQSAPAETGIEADRDPGELTCELGDVGPAAVDRFVGLLRFPTVSSLLPAHADTHVAPERADSFASMLEYLKGSYTDAYNVMELEMVGAGSLTTLLTWRGSDPALLPALFISHYDVVPVSNGTEGDWLHGPFSGARADGDIWARGTLDIKFGVAGLLEAAGVLARRGFRPQRTLCFAFGHDEEVGGSLGAAEAAKLLSSRGVEFEIIVDEGGLIFKDGVRPLTRTPVALVGLSEKVYTTVEVNLTAKGGHSSMPPTDGSDIASQTSRLLAYVAQHPLSATLREPMLSFFHALAPHAPYAVMRALMAHAHVWPLRQLLAKVFVAAGPQTAATVRTTTAVTYISAGVADNVLPQSGVLRFNCRSHPYDSRDDLLAYFESALRAAKCSGATARVHEATHFGQTPSVADSGGPHFAALKRAIQETWRIDGKGVVVAPMLMTGGTDSKHYAGITRNGVLRFVPYMLNSTAGDMARIHGTNERVAEADFLRGICTYTRILELMSGPM